MKVKSLVSSVAQATVYLVIIVEKDVLVIQKMYDKNFLNLFLYIITIA